MEVKRVLCILHLPPPIHGAAMVGKLIYDSELINKKLKCKYINLTTAGSISDIGKNSYKKFIIFLRLYKKIFFTLIKNKYDLCYLTINSSGPSFYKELIIVLILKVFRQHIVYHYHNKGISNNQSTFLLSLLYRFQFKNARVILLSSKLYYDIQKFVPKHRVYYCSNGIPDFKHDFNHVANKGSIPNILFLSNMLITKGIEVLLKTCQILVERKLQFHCNIAGEWTQEMSRIKYENICKDYKICSNITAFGKIQGEEKESLFAKSDIFVFPSYYPRECFPLVILEAMKWALPVISTDEGAISEIIDIGVTGDIVTRKNPEKLADSICRLLDNPALIESMGLKGRKKFMNLYTLERFEQRFVDVIEAIYSDFNVKSK